MRCDSSEGLKMAVKKKLGVGILYEDVVRTGVRRGEFKILKLPGLKMDGNLFVISRQGKSLSVHARNFLSLFRERRRNSYSQRAYSGQTPSIRALALLRHAFLADSPTGLIPMAWGGLDSR